MLKYDHEGTIEHRGHYAVANKGTTFKDWLIAVRDALAFCAVSAIFMALCYSLA